MDAPRVEVEFRGSVPASPDRQQWRVAWRVENHNAEPVQLVAAWLPHSRFRCDERGLSALPPLAADQATQVELVASCSEAPGTAVPAAFLIVRFLWRGQPWRLLARMTVTCDGAGAPRAQIERVDLQRVGFSR
ncbi:MAG: hypothetical protein HYY05_02800 [Chloroflexi bacterium]|nr:hypothetical protein [Chloroflexota bacterium]